MKTFTKTEDWSGRQYHATCWRKHMANLKEKYTPVDHEQRARFFWIVEEIRLKELRDAMPLSYSYLVHDARTPLYKAP
jgi:hypothetical protein